MKVLDLTHHIAGPYCTKLLADYGADVVKIEKPGEGDSARRMGPFPGDVPHREKSGLFLHLNTNKRSVTLDLKTRTAQTVVKELAKSVDVVVESFQPGVMASFGLDYTILKGINPALVVVSISNFGQSGPYRGYKASDLVLSAMGGPMGGLPGREPLKYAATVTQFMVGLLAASGVLSAFYLAKWEGLGQYLDLSMMDLLISNVDRGPAIVGHQFMGGTQRTATGSSRNAFPPAGLYPCKDGYMHWFPVPNWPRAARMLGRNDLLTDPRFATPEARLDNFQEVDRIISEWMLERTKKECWEAGVAADLICGPCYTVEDLWKDAHMAQRGFWTQVEHAAVGRTSVPGAPFILTRAPRGQPRPAPLLGQDNREVLGALGFSGEDLVRMKGAGVI